MISHTLLMKKLPIWKQSFASLREKNDMVYIDKTQYIFDLIERRAPYFLSRPRRFGKSLLIDTIRCLFEWRKELFEWLYIHDKWDWEVKYPVIKIVFWDGFYENREFLQRGLQNILKTYAERYDIMLEAINIPDRFRELIVKISEKTGRQVVVLVDEYDKPILDQINNLEKASEIKDELKGFYSVLKWADEYLKFVMLTGVTKFSKVSVFSGLNNLQDITLNKSYNAICGYTLPEIIENFWPEGYLEWVDLDQMRVWYNGYSFWNTSETLYNPFWLLNFFDKKQYQNYWFSTATPTFLINLIKTGKYDFSTLDLERIKVNNEILDAFDIETIELKTLLFQSGYLTIKEIVNLGWEMSYTLGVPNEEVRKSLNSHLIKDYLWFTNQSFNFDKLERLYWVLTAWDIDGYVTIIKQIFAGIPYANYVNNHINEYEWFYASVLYSFMAYTGIEFIAEDFTNKWRIDFTLRILNKVYIIEFKVEETGKKSLEQIKERKYYEKYAWEGKEIYLVGMSFDSESKNIGEVEWEMLKN